MVVIATETTERSDPRTSPGLLDFPTPPIAAATRGGVVGGKTNTPWGGVWYSVISVVSVAIFTARPFALPALSAC